MAHRSVPVQRATPRHVERVEDCHFYHVMDLPGQGTVGQGWDLRKNIDDYLGRFDFSGRTVLDVGAASGMLSFHMEKRGAQVTSFDVLSLEEVDFVPYAKPDYDLPKFKETCQPLFQKFRNSYWLAHRLLKSKAAMYYGTIYDIPAEVGDFDVVVLGMILPHLREPFQGLLSASRRAKEWLIITQQSAPVKDGVAYFMPDVKTCSPNVAWWSLSESCVERMLGVVGFRLEKVTRGDYLCTERWGDTVKPGKERCTTFIAKRLWPAAAGTAA